MDKIELSIIIVTYNSGREIDTCLNSIINNCFSINFDLKIVDNASSDETIAIVRKSFPDVKICDLKDNIGFSAANNLGIKLSRAPYFLLLNPDTILQPNAIQNLVQTLKEKPDVALVGPRLLNPDGSLQPSCREFPNLLNHLIGMTEIYRIPIIRRFLGRRLVSLSEHDKARYVDWVSGACMLVRRTSIDEVGLMNEAYFMYSEELEWQHRFVQAGWKIWFNPAAEIIHIGGASTSHHPSERIIWQYESIYQFYQEKKSHFEYIALRFLVALVTLPKILILTIAGFNQPRRLALRNAFWKIIWMS